MHVSQMSNIERGEGVRVFIVFLQGTANHAYREAVIHENESVALFLRTPLVMKNGSPTDFESFSPVSYFRLLLLFIEAHYIR